MPSGLLYTEARDAIKSTIGRTLEYPLPATAMDKEQCKKINKAFKKCALPKSGIVRSAAEALVYSPEHLLELGLKDIETQQKIAHIKMLLEHGIEETVTGQLIRILCEGVMIEFGVKGDLFWLHPSFCS